MGKIYLILVIPVSCPDPFSAFFLPLLWVLNGRLERATSFQLSSPLPCSWTQQWDTGAKPGEWEGAHVWVFILFLLLPDIVLLLVITPIGQPCRHHLCFYLPLVLFTCPFTFRGSYEFPLFLLLGDSPSSDRFSTYCTYFSKESF